MPTMAALETVKALNESDKTLEVMNRMAQVQIEEAIRKTVALDILERKAAAMTERGVGVFGHFRAARYGDTSLRAIVQSVFKDTAKHTVH